MCEQDGVILLLHAIETYRTIAADDTLFAFVGGGPDQPRMKAMAEHMGLATGGSTSPVAVPTNSCGLIFRPPMCVSILTRSPSGAICPP